MLLRIDAYPSEAPLQPRPKPFYACLATSASSSTPYTNDAEMAGRLITVGRKKGDVIFGGDKSVSREHCILRLVSANKTHQQHVAGGASTTRIPPPMKPRNPEEIRACDNDLQMCVVLENIGKVGSFVVQELPPVVKGSNNAATKSDDSDTEDDDNTDDEGLPGTAASASQAAAVGGVQLSPAARALIRNPSTVTLKYVGPGKSIVLEQLSSSNSSDTPVIVQCGKMGSTIVIQRKPVRVIRSGEVEKRLAADWRARLHCIGVQETKTLDESTTHLFTAVRDTTTKQLAAWCWGLPIVTSSYLQALWERKSPASPLPQEVDCEPDRDGQTFWYTPADSQLFFGATFLSCKADDIELVVRAAGAAVVPLYDLTQTEALAKVEECLHSDELVLDKAQNYSCFALSDDKSRRKLPRLLKERGVPQVSGKTIAKCITQQQPLHDGKGKAIGNRNPTRPSSIHKTSPDTADSKTVATQQINEQDEVAKETQEPEPAPEELEVVVGAKEDDDFPAPEDDNKSDEGPQSQSQVMDLEVADGANNVSLEKPAKKDTAIRGDSQTRVDSDKQQALEIERAKETDTDTSGSVSKAKGAASGDPDASSSTRPSKRKHDGAREDAAAEEKEPASLPVHKRARNVQKYKGNDDNDDDGHPAKRKKLESNGNGWEVAAPKGKRRRAYISSKEEILEATGYEEIGEAAPTETDKGMILAPMQQPNRFTSRSSGGADFKGFRKNPVVRAPARSRIQLRSVLPRVPEKQQGQFDEQQRALEEQQQKADELFGDGRRKATTSSRRRRVS